MTDGPFAVDVEATLDALDPAWGDEVRRDLDQ